MSDSLIIPRFKIIVYSIAFYLILPFFSILFCDIRNISSYESDMRCYVKKMGVFPNNLCCFHKQEFGENGGVAFNLFMSCHWYCDSNFVLDAITIDMCFPSNEKKKPKRIHT